MDKISLHLAVRQKGLCPLCKQALIVGAEYEPDSPREWINWFAATKKMLHKHHFTYRQDGGTDERSNLRLVHSECGRLPELPGARADHAVARGPTEAVAGYESPGGPARTSQTHSVGPERHQRGNGGSRCRLWGSGPVGAGL
ncbi:HNH endonuclease [Streptomyces sp. NPDC001142]